MTWEGVGKPLPRARVCASRAGTSFRCGSSDSVGLCRFPSTAGWRIDDCGLMIADCGLWIVDCKIVSLGCGLDRLSVVFRFRIVRGFCFVKCDAGRRLSIVD